MRKVLYNGEYIELNDELERGSVELDMLTNGEENQDNLEDTIELKSVNLEDTIELKVSDLVDTQEIIIGEIHE